MTISVDKLISLFRSQMDDVAEPYFWSSDTICEYLDEAQKEFAAVMRIFKTSDSTIVVTADDPWVTFPTEIIEVNRASLAGRVSPLEIVNENEVDDHIITSDYGTLLRGDWMTVKGQPALLVLDVDTSRGRLAPIPTETTTLTIYYDRYPLKTITASSSKTELTDDRHAHSLVLFARSKAYGNHDADTYNVKMEEDYLDRFYRRLDTFDIELTKKRRRPGTVKYGGY